MTRQWRIARNIGIGLVGLLAVVVVAGILLVQTDWFRNYVRQKIITATQEGIGGRVEVGSFSFNARALEAVVSDFIIHGKEQAGAAPFVRIPKVQVNLRLLTSLRRLIDISYLGVERPEVNLLTFEDGTNNIPEPTDKKPKSDTTILDSLVDLAVDYFQISNGMIAYNSQKQAIDVKGNNLRAQLWYNLLAQSYKGQLSLQPLYVVSGRNTPVVFTLTLPVLVERTRISLDGAKISTPASELTINGSLGDLNSPKVKARVNGHLAIIDLKNVADLPLDMNVLNAPSSINVDGNASIADNRITVDGFRISLGASNVEASGLLKDPQGAGSLEFKSRLALDELGPLAKISARPSGFIVANGTAKLDSSNNYYVTGNIEGRDLAFSQGAQRIRNVNLFTAVNLDPHRLDLKGLRLSAFGGRFDGNVSLEEFARYNVSGNLGHLDLQTAAAALGQKALPYDGVVSGLVQARGDLKAMKSKLPTASAKLSIAPGARGIPVSGRINADYNGAADNVTVVDSYIALPNTRLNLSGSINDRMNLEVTSKNLNDFFAAVSPGTPPTITLNGGQAQFRGVVTGGIHAPQISGHLGLNRFAVQGRQFDSIGVDVAAATNYARVSNGLLQRGSMQASFEGTAGLQNWSPKPNQPLKATASVRNGDLADAMVLAGQPPGGYSGNLTVDANVNGTIGNPTGTADLQVLKGTLKSEPFDRLQARVNMSDQLIAVPTASLTAGAAQINMTAELQHPRDSMTTGRLHARVQSNQVNLSQIGTLQAQRPNTSGELRLNADVTGNLATTRVNGKDETQFLLTSVNGDTSAHDLRFEGQSYGDVNAKASTSGQTVNYDVDSNFVGSSIKISGNTQLTAGYPSNAEADLRNLPIEKLLLLARRTDVPVRGSLSGTARFTGTMENPQGSVDLDLANAVLHDEPIDHVRAKLSYLTKQVDVPMLEIVSGPSRIELTGRYDHAAGSLQAGDLQFRVKSNRIELARIRNAQKLRPGLGGNLQLAASGAGTVRQGTPQLLLRDLNADVGATEVSVQGKNVGALSLKAATNANRLNFTLESNLAGAAVEAHGDTQLSNEYPVNVELNFKDVNWSRLQPLIGSSTGQPSPFDVATEGQLIVHGPILKTDQIQASLRIPVLQVNSASQARAASRPVSIHNDAPISVSLNRGLIRIDSAHLVGPQTDINVKGTASLLSTQPVEMDVAANTNIGLLQNFSQDIYSSGNVVLLASIRGTVGKPLVNGKLELQNASLNYAGLPNGLQNASGLIVFNGATATVRGMTAQSGGGKVTLSGFASYTDTLRLGLRATANGVRVRLQQGVSIVANAFVNVTGTGQSSVASGAINISRITYTPQSDFGSILTRTAPPVQTPMAPNPLLDNMRLDIRVRTTAATSVQASVVENIQVDADLRVKGTASSPGILGMVSITEGDLVFFGSKYEVTSGNITFYNPVRIEPVLNVTLKTQAKGVSVVLTVTGPIDNMKLSYTSDPPLQFQEIVALLASGKTPTSDPTLVANQPSQPQQSFQQMGETAIVSKAIADPVASRLQRVFGVSQLKIDPTFTSGSDLPQARLTLQQQVATNVTFTYVTALNDPNTQVIRIEWAFNPRWSAIANRDENGIVSLNFIYKKQFR